MSNGLLEISGLRISYRDTIAVDGVALDVREGEIVALMGESGSGKTACCLAILGLLDRAARVTGSIRYRGTELLDGTGRGQAALRGRELAMVFQEATDALNPVRTIGSQLIEMLRTHRPGPLRAARQAAAAMLGRVQVPDAARRMRQYPHQLSGGLNQRAVIGMMLLHGPRLLIADEPTTALDMTTQAEILKLLARLRDEQGVAVLLVTHDLGIASAIADRVAVMRHGRIVEAGPATELLARPAHPYTQALVDARLPWRAAPAIPRPAPTQPPVLRLADIRKSYAAPVLRGVELEISHGEAFGLVGESGAGKSTLARIAAGIEAPDAGTVAYGPGIVANPRKSLHRSVQYVFQDPAGALDRRLRVRDQLREPLDIHRIGTRAERLRQCGRMLALVELDPAIAERFPHELSGGQRQRVVLARALMLEPRLLICDEPVAALDAATQAQILRLLRALRERLNLSLLFVSHDLPQVRHLCDRAAVLANGAIVESGPCEQVLGEPAHPYTQALVAAIPRPGMTRAMVDA
jgi:peptide/nickel transport system ATP-binding protein